MRARTMDPDEYGGADPSTLPVDSAQGGASTGAGDDLPGFPVRGAWGWRAGASDQNGGVLGMVRVPPDGQATSAASFAGPNDPRLIKTAGGAPMNPSGALDYERNSWRWNDPDALNYDLQRKEEQLAQARTMAALGGMANRASGVVTKRAGVASPGGILGDVFNFLKSDNPVGAAGAATSAYMTGVESPMLQNEIQAIQARLTQLQGQSST